MAKINMQQVISNLNGTPIPEVDEQATREARIANPNAADVTRSLTLGALCTNALLCNTDASMAKGPDEKVAALNMARRIFDAYMTNSNGGVVNLEKVDQVLLSELVNTHFTILIAGQALEMLNPKSNLSVVN